MNLLRSRYSHDVMRANIFWLNQVAYAESFVWSTILLALYSCARDSPLTYITLSNISRVIHFKIWDWYIMRLYHTYTPISICLVRYKSMLHGNSLNYSSWKQQNILHTQIWLKCIHGSYVKQFTQRKTIVVNSSWLAIVKTKFNKNSRTRSTLRLYSILLYIPSGDIYLHRLQ